MPTSETKPPGGDDFQNCDDATKKLVETQRASQKQLSHSTAWPIVALDHGSVAEGLTNRASVAIEIKCGITPDEQQIARRGVLQRLTGNDVQSLEFELGFAKPLPADINPLAVYAGKLDIWQFEPQTLESTHPLELAEPDHAGALEGAALSLAAAGPEAAEVEGEMIEAANDRLRMRWVRNQLQVLVDQPPMRRGQPVVVEVHFDDRGERQSYRRAFSVEFDVTHGEHAGFVWGAIDCHEPSRFERFKITARPLAPDELDLLDSKQLSRLLAGQQMSAMSVKEGNRFSARSEEQRYAVADPAATWFLRVAQKEVTL